MRYLIAFLGADLSTTVFLSVYLLFFIALTMGALILAGRILRQDEVQQRQRRLGRSLWLCPECHALYEGAMYQCPAGHATALFVEASSLLVSMGGDEFATEAMAVVAGRDGHN